MEGLDEVEVNPYANIALAQKEKVMEHIQRRHEAFLTVPIPIIRATPSPLIVLHKLFVSITISPHIRFFRGLILSS